MRRNLLLLLFASMGLVLHAQITESAADAVKNMGVGWNLGNTLDANKSSGLDFTSDDYWGTQGLDSETYWGQPYTKPELFAMMRNAGFGAIRVPITWYNHMDKDGNVDAEWMHRVREVVDMVLSNDLYCIINVHHDTGADGGSFKSWIKADRDNFAANQARYEKLWSQIANEFQGYGEKLLFEAYNEMLDRLNSWCFASFNASGQYDADIAASAYEGINSYAQSFVNTVRATGGNNVTRNLVVNTYAASNGGGTWNKHLKEPLTEMAMPEDQDPTQNHIIYEVHAYPQIGNSNGSDRKLSDIQKEIDSMIKDLNDNLVSKGAPVIIGEWGTSNVDSGAGKTDYDVRRDLMKQFVDYFVKQTKANGMGTFYWMGLTDGLYRSMPAFHQADLAETMIKAYHGDDFQGEFPDANQMEQVVCFDGDKQLGWGNGISIQANLFAGFETQPVLVLTYQQNGEEDDIQFFYGDWSGKPSFIVDGQSFEGDLQPSTYYDTPNLTEHVTTFSFDATTFASVKTKGLIVHGNSIRLYKAVLQSSTAEIQTILQPLAPADLYNLAGQRVVAPGRGFYIQGGQKVIVK